MPRSIEIYQNFGTLEWCNKYYFPDGVTITESSVATSLKNAMQPIQCAAIAYTRWRYLDGSGHVVSEGTLTGNGTYAGEMMPIHYAVLVRLVPATEVGRPSTKYIHGYGEGAQANNVVAGTFLTALATYGTALVSNQVANSNGAAIQGVTFRGFTRRKRMRVMGT